MSPTARWPRCPPVPAAAAALLLVVAAGCGRTRPPSPGPPQTVQRVVTTVTADGMRRAIVYHPSSAGRGAPLVVVLHGGFGSAAQAESGYGWDGAAERGRFVVAYPDGIGRSWRASSDCCGLAQRRQADDVGYLHRLVHALAGTEGVDPHRVYAVGISNGAMLAYTWACTIPGDLAGIGPVAGSLLVPCPSPAPLTVVAVHGSADQNVPIDGGVGPKGLSGVDNPPLARTIAVFRIADHCPALPAVRAQPPLTVSTWACRDGRRVVTAVIVGAGHQWPGSPPPGPGGRALGLDPPSPALDATAFLWSQLEAGSARP